MHLEFEDQITLNPGKYVEGKFLLENGFYLHIRYNFTNCLSIKTTSQTGDILYVQTSSVSLTRFEYHVKSSHLTARTSDGLCDEYDISKSDRDALAYFLSNLFEFQLG